MVRGGQATGRGARGRGAHGAARIGRRNGRRSERRNQLRNEPRNERRSGLGSERDSGRRSERLTRHWLVLLIASLLAVTAGAAAIGAAGAVSGAEGVAPLQLAALSRDGEVRQRDTGPAPGSVGGATAVVHCGGLAVWVGRATPAAPGRSDGSPGRWSELYLDLRVRNDGVQAMTITPLDFSLRDQRGELWEGMSRRVASPSMFPATVLAPGEEARGFRVFTLPQGRIAAFLRVESDGSDSAVEVRLPALDVPVDDLPGEAGTQLADEDAIPSGAG